MSSFRGYLHTLNETCATRWNHFWFTPVGPLSLCMLRVLVGCFSLYFVGSFTADLSTWFAAEGLLPPQTVQELTGQLSGSSTRPSYLMLITDPTLLTLAHAASCLALLSFTLGFQTRVSSVLALGIVLSYVHRGPMITGPFSAVLTMLLLYLVLAPCGRYWSIDAWLRSRRRNAPPPEPSVAANISRRLIQLHLCGFYLVTGCSMLAGETWWAGEAVWWLIAQSNTRLVDLTLLHDVPAFYLVNLWTHTIVFVQLSFAILIWHPVARPLVLVVSALVWLSLIPITGLAAHCLLMIAAGLVYVDTGWLNQRFAQQSATTPAAKKSSLATA